MADSLISLIAPKGRRGNLKKEYLWLRPEHFKGEFNKWTISLERDKIN
jgi:hypothetical protein